MNFGTRDWPQRVNRLQRGEGRQEVTESNVAILMKLAARDGHTVLQEELREWKAN